MSDKEIEEIKKHVDKMSKNELIDLAYKMLVTRYKSNLRKRKYYAKKASENNER